MPTTQSMITETYAAIYLRLSRDDQNGNSESMSIAHQRDMLLDYCEERRWKVYDIYVDDGITGTNFERPGFQRMIKDIEDGCITVVLTKDLSRLGRNYIMTGQYTDFFFPEHGVRYIAVNDSYDSDKDDNDIAPFKNILNEMYAKDISKKVRSARLSSARQGRFLGSKPPYGYVRSDENKYQLVIDPPAAEIVRRLFREFASGESGRSIAVKLNAEGIDTPSDYYYKQTGKRSTRSDKCNQWGSATVIQLLRNEVYMGHMIQGKRKVSSFKSRKFLIASEDDWIVVRNTHEPIIEEYEWDSVQRRLAKASIAPSNHSIKTNSTDEINLFSGIIRCADCGGIMAFNRKMRKNGTEKLYYRCSRYANNGNETCTTHTIDMEMLEYVLLHDIQHHAKTAISDEKGLFDRLMAFSDEACKNDGAAKEKSLRDAQGRISFIETAVKTLFEERVAGNVPEGILKTMLADYQIETEALHVKVAALRKQIQESRDSRADVQRWLNLVKECASIERLDRATAFQLIDEVSVHEQADECGIRTLTLEIKYNFVGCISSLEH